MAVSLVVGTVAIALGAFVAVSPTRAAKIWGSERLEEMASQDRIPLFRWYRVFGLLLCLAGVLVVIDSIVFSEYR
jgi:nitric oxide reductase large subunit